MAELAFRDGIMDRIRLRESRYDERAYLFVLSALEFCQQRLPERRHITGRELSLACRDLALERFGVSYERHVVSAHRTPVWMAEFAQEAETRGIEVIVAGAGGAAHLPGMTAAHTILPVLGVPVQSSTLNGLDSLLSIVQMPGGIPVGTLAIGTAGAKNAGLLAARILALSDAELRDRLKIWTDRQTSAVMDDRELTN